MKTAGQSELADLCPHPTLLWDATNDSARSAGVAADTLVMTSALGQLAGRRKYLLTHTMGHRCKIFYVKGLRRWNLIEEKIQFHLIKFYKIFRWPADYDFISSCSDSDCFSFC